MTSWLRICFTVARWEFFRYFKWKDQLFGLLSLLIGAAIGFGAVYMSRSANRVQVAVLGASESFQFPEKGNLVQVFETYDEATWKEKVQAGELDGLLKVTRNAEERFRAELIVRKEPAWLDELRPTVEAERLRWEIHVAQLSTSTVERLLTPAEMEVTSLSTAEASKLDRIVAYIMLAAMVLTSWIGLAYMMTGITSEKQLRVTEQIVSAIRPQMWIDGKLFGITAAAIGSLAFLFVTSALCIPFARVVGIEFELPDSLTRWDLIPWLLLFYFGGVFFWNCFYAAVTAVINDPNTSSRTTLLLLPMLPMMASGLVVAQPDGMMMRILSLTPGASSTAMPIRMILGEVGVWEVLISLILLVMGVVILRIVAGRIFAAGIMLYGKEPSWVDILRWALTSRVDANGLPIVLLLLITFSLSAASPAVGYSQQESSTPIIPWDHQLQLDSFDVVWHTVKDVHWDENRVGEKWNQLRNELRPQVEKARNIEEVRTILQHLLDQLGQSHCGIIPIDSYEIVEEQSRLGGEGVCGLTIRYIDNQLMVTKVGTDSPANISGIEPGWVLKSVGRRSGGGNESETNVQEIESQWSVISSEELIERTKKGIEKQVVRFETAIGLAATGLTMGTVGETVELEFLDRHNQKQKVALTLVKSSGFPARMGHLPMINVEFDSKLLPDNIGYVSFNAFFDPARLIKEFQNALHIDYATSKGLVIDLRGNMGGLVLLTMGLSSWFVEERVNLGVMRMKGAPLNLTINPRKPRFMAPVAVLIDECSISAAEIYAGGLKDIKAARVFGQTSAGLVLPSNVTRLPNQDGFQYVTADYASASGQVLEGQGVEPDETIVLTRQLFELDTDPVLAAARRWILSQSK